jgi:unsaturated chondroitin disaccharide hydrolase
LSDPGTSAPRPRSARDSSTGSVVHTGADAVGEWLSRRTGSPDVEGGVARAWERYLEAAGREIRRSADHPPGLFPHVTADGRWQLLDAEARSDDSGGHYEHGNWTAGFRSGVAWLHALGTGQHGSAQTARHWARAVSGRATDHTTHDIGFLFFPGTALPDLAGRLGDDDADLVATGHQAARTLAARWNPRTGLLQAFGPVGSPRLAGTSTIDTMMNLPLLWWAGRHGGDGVLFDIARRHARTSARLYLRPDGSTYHLLHLDPLTGAVLRRGTFQGSDDASCWSRGQAWSVCGMAWAFAATGEAELLETAERCAAYFFDRLPDDAIAPWDFTADDQAPDASASAAVALGCLFLEQVHPNGDAGRAYGSAGRALLSDLGDNSINTGPDDGILLHSTYSLPHNRGVDGATGFGDFYVGLALGCAVEALPVTLLADGSA